MFDSIHKLISGSKSIMGNLRKNLDDSQEALDMQNWVVKHKPLQSYTSYSNSSEDEYPFEELDETARHLTLNEL